MNTPAIKFAKDIGYEILEMEGEPIDINYWEKEFWMYGSLKIILLGC